MRFWVDSGLLLDEWQDQVASFSVETDLTEGEHDLMVEYYDNGYDATLHLDWQRLSGCSTGVELANVSHRYVQPGQPFASTVVLRVTGGELRGDRGDHLQNTDGSTYGAEAAQPVVGVVPAGEYVTFRPAMTAPATSGTYPSRWQMQVEGAYGGRCWPSEVGAGRGSAPGWYGSHRPTGGTTCACATPSAGRPAPP